MSTMMATLAPSGALFQRWRQAWRASTQRHDAALHEEGGDAAKVRALADSYRESDPGFASDLYAAADRYERECEAAAGR
jgi:hypothetical protein